MKETKSSKARRSHKGKQHPAHAQSFLNVAADLLSNTKLMPEATQAVHVVAHALKKEADRLRKIVR